MCCHVMHLFQSLIMNFRTIKSYLFYVNQSCLDIIEVYKKMQLSYDNCVLSVGLARRWFSLVGVV
jgi:hypothetical protein